MSPTGCMWRDCDRIGAWAAPEGQRQGFPRLFCSLHHPAGRVHIEARTAEIARLRGALEAVWRELESIGDAVDVSDLWPHWREAHRLVLDAVSVPLNTYSEHP